MKKTNKKNNILKPMIGLLIFLLAICQVIIILIVINQGKSQIVYEGNTITTEVCSLWYEKKEPVSTDSFDYNNLKIPINVIQEVCPKWLEVKQEIDSRKSFNSCEAYSDLKTIKGKIENNTEYYLIYDEWIERAKIEENCLNLKHKHYK